MESERRSLIEQGFVVLPAVIEPGALRRLHDRVALFYQGWDQYPASTRKELAVPESAQEYQPVREINWPPAAHELLVNEPAMTAIREAIDALAGGACRLIHVNSLLKPAHNGAPIAPHQDTAYNVRALNHPLTAWVPFEEINQENGAVYYLPGSHKLGDIEHQRDKRMRWLSPQQVRATGKPLVTYTGQPGSVGVHDSRVVHGSHPNRSPRDRLALSLRFERIGNI